MNFITSIKPYANTTQPELKNYNNQIYAARNYSKMNIQASNPDISFSGSIKKIFSSISDYFGDNKNRIDKNLLKEVSKIFDNNHNLKEIVISEKNRLKQIIIGEKDNLNKRYISLIKGPIFEKNGYELDDYPKGHMVQRRYMFYEDGKVIKEEINILDKSEIKNPTDEETIEHIEDCLKLLIKRDNFRVIK